MFTKMKQLLHHYCVLLLLLALSGVATASQVQHDLLGGVIVGGNTAKQTITIQSYEGAEINVIVSEDTWIHYIQNQVLNERYDKQPTLEELVKDWRGRPLLVNGLNYVGLGEKLYAKELILFTDSLGTLRFEQPDWWRQQAESLADFWLRAQGLVGQPDKNKQPIDGASYRTVITKVGTQRLCTEEERSACLQETATLSRLIYGLSSAYLMTGDQRFITAAEALVKYQRVNMRVLLGSDYVYWLHGIDGQRKIIGSLFNEDKGTIPLYEQIYCLAGLTQYYRITGDTDVLSDIRKSIAFIDHYYWDEKQLGYFSHISPDPFTDATSPPDRNEALDRVSDLNRRKKNWNSIGDHLPAYMLNLYLGTGEEQYAKRLDLLSRLIIEHFPKADSPFVAERFSADWTPELDYGWQQDRGVVGHNLKIVWSMGQMYFLTGAEIFRRTAVRIADLMIQYGEDHHAGGWYDVIERHTDADSGRHLHVWHNRKAWWQQEQGILANYITYAHTHNSVYLDSARRGVGFYNYAFLDKRDGGTFFDVMADGIPYLDGDRADKGSHSKSGYHDLELTYFANAYVNLMVHRRPIKLYFQPLAQNHSKTLRVLPLSLPKGYVALQAVSIDGVPHTNFDKDRLTVQLPASDRPLKVSVVIVPRDISPSGRAPTGNATLHRGARLPVIPAKGLESSSIFSAQALGTVNSHRWRWNHNSDLNDMDGDIAKGFNKNFYLHPRGGKNGDGIYALRFTVNHDAARTYKQPSADSTANLVTGGSADTARNIFFHVQKAGEYHVHFDPLTGSYKISPDVVILEKIESIQLNGFVYDGEQGSSESYNDQRSFPVQKWDALQFSHQMEQGRDGVWSKRIYLRKDGGMDHRHDGVYQFLFSANQNSDWGFCAINGKPWRLGEGCGYDSKSGRVIDSDIVARITKDDWYTIRVHPNQHWYSIEPQVDILNTISSFQLNGTVHQSAPWDPAAANHQMKQKNGEIWEISLPLSAEGGDKGSGVYAVNISLNQEWMLDSLGFGAWVNGEPTVTQIATWHAKPQEPNIMFKVNDTAIHTFLFDSATGRLNIKPAVVPVEGIHKLRLVGDVYSDPALQWNTNSELVLMDSNDGIRFSKLVDLDAYHTYNYKYVANDTGFLWAFTDYPYDGYRELANHGDPPALEYTPTSNGTHRFEVNILTGEYQVLREVRCAEALDNVTHAQHYAPTDAAR